MSMDSAMDSLSTTSEHSVASSSGSPVITVKQSLSPALTNNNNNTNNSNASSTHNHPSINHQPSHHSHHHHHSQHHHSSSSNNNSNRSPTPVSPPPIRHQNSPLTSSGGGPHMMPMPHPLSPPQVSTPNSIAASMSVRGISQQIPHLPPHGLGLFNSLQMMHPNPLELMAAAHNHVPPRSYNSPPPISTSDPTANECKLVDYRGTKVAAFIIAGDTMLCLPQAFELFLKHLVGGLHTVYTKLKRLDIVPLVCNVEQVRILRGLGAIQPGVNRCKLLSCKDFDILYRDCTTASSRPGRPPKRGPVGLSLPASHMSHHPSLKKHRQDNGDYPYENGHLSDISRLEKSPLLANGYNPPPTHINHMQFMQMNHHPGSMMSPGMPSHGLPRPDNGTLMKGQPGMPPGMDAIARSGIWENCRAAYEDIVKHLERLREERVDDRNIPNVEQKVRDLSSQNGSSNGHSPVLNLSKSGAGTDHNSLGDRSDRSDVHSPAPTIRDDDENISDDNVSDIDEREEKDEDLTDNERDMALPQPPTSVPTADVHHQQAINYSTLAATAAAVAASSVNKGSVVVQSSGPADQNLSSTETLLRNIQSLLTVAADNARQQERQISYEKAELKMDVLREREHKDSLERQLTDERKLRGLYQKRFKRERKARMRMQHQLDAELKRRNQMEEALKASGAPPEALRLLSSGLMADNLPNDHKERSSSTDRRTDSPYAPPSNRDMQQQPQNPSQQQPLPPPTNPDGKPWNYPGLDLMATGAFWQNYSETLAQEIEMGRKARQSGERDVKSPLQDRQNYYKNSVLFSSAT